MRTFTSQTPAMNTFSTLLAVNARDSSDQHYLQNTSLGSASNQGAPSSERQEALRDNPGRLRIANEVFVKWVEMPPTILCSRSTYSSLSFVQIRDKNRTRGTRGKLARQTKRNLFSVTVYCLCIALYLYACTSI